MVPRTGGTRMAVPTGRSGRTTKGPPPTHARRGDQGSPWDARTLALAEQGFYWPGMGADVSRVCMECDCAMLKSRRGGREPLHQYIVGVPMEH